MMHKNTTGATFLYATHWLALTGSLLASHCFADSPPTILLQAESYNLMSGVALENTSDLGGGQNVGWIDANDWMAYTINPTNSGWYKVDYRIASTVNNATLVLSQNAQDISENVYLPNTNGWQNWQTVSSRVYLKAGTQPLAIYVRNSGFNINWFSLTLEDPCAAATPISIPGKIEAEAFCNMQGIQTENTSDGGGGANIGWTDAGDWMDYKIQVAKTGTYKVNYRIASTQANGSVSFGTSPLTTFGNTGGWQNWQNFSAQINLAAGAQTLRLNIAQPGFNINWIELTAVATTVSSSTTSSTLVSKSTASSKSATSIQSSSLVASSKINSSIASSIKSSIASSAVTTSSAILSSSSATSIASVDFGPHVKIMDMSQGDAKIQSDINAILSIQELNHALDSGQQENPERSAILFKPGTYNVNIPVGFYTQVLGLGASPDDVKINGKLSSEPYLSILHPEWGNNATQNFWRGVENFSTTDNLVTWAVSQSTFFRRMHVNGDVHLYEVDYSRPSWNIKSWGSGGWISDSLISGTIDSGLQQQWFTRNSNWQTTWTGDDNNFLVFLGVPSTTIQPATVATHLPQTPVIAEKPQLLFNGSQYEVFVPALKTNSSGISWTNGKGAGTTLPINQFYITKETDTAASINAALDQGKHLIITPGIYHLLDSIRITKANTIVLGLGFPTLHPTTGKAALSIADVDGVRVANIVVSAGSVNSLQLIEVGATGSTNNHSTNPSVLSDLFVAIGGAMEGQADKALVINSNDVIIDHTWLWRADHGNGVGWDWNKSKNGIVVNGNNVTAYGLFVEHFEEFQTLWNGNNGRTYFYQSEIPYDPPYQEAWSSASGVKGWASYKVASNVTSHEAWGLGIYTAFNVADLTLTRSIEAPVNNNVKFHNMVNAKFNNISGGNIDYLINDKKDPAGVTTGDFGAGKPRLANYPAQ